MQIDSIEIFHIALPLRQPRETARGSIETLETVLVRMAHGDVAGWGEVSPGNAPVQEEEWTGGVFACLRDWMAPRLTKTMVESGADLQERLRPFRGNRHAKAALDMAWWDLNARLQGKPLHVLLGGQRDRVEVGVSFDRMETIDELFEAVQGALDAGFGRVELKFRPGWDVQMVNFVRSQFPTQTFHIDCEGELRLDHMEMLCRLDDFYLAFIEQPLPADDLVGLAMVQEAIRTPLALDGSIRTQEQADMALELHSGKFINLKPGRVGGLTAAMAIHDLAHGKCTPCFVGVEEQSSLGARAAWALAAKPNCTYPADYFAAEKLLAVDLVEPLRPEPDPETGKLAMVLPPLPGLGVEPSPSVLEQLTLRRAVC